MTHPTANPSPDGWTACPAGELARLGARRRSRRRAQGLTAVALVALGLLVAQRWLAGGVPAVLHPFDPVHAGMACSAVRAQIDAFVDHSLDEASAARIEAHVEHCPDCRGLIDTARRRRTMVHAAAKGQEPEWLALLAPADE